MKNRKINIFFLILITGVFLSGLLVLMAYVRTWNKCDIEFSIHINKKLVQESTFGESPTFAIWVENPRNGMTRTIFVTQRAGLGDWEGKSSVPAALPRWFEINNAEKQLKQASDREIPDAITGATPKPGYFKTRLRVPRGSDWICWIEINLAGDFNDEYKEYNEIEKTEDEYKTGQPALLYKADVKADEGNFVSPEIIGMSILDSHNKTLIQPLKGITTAKNVFDKISIKVIHPKPRIIEHKVFLIHI